MCSISAGIKWLYGIMGHSMKVNGAHDCVCGRVVTPAIIAANGPAWSSNHVDCATITASLWLPDSGQWTMMASRDIRQSYNTLLEFGLIVSRHTYYWSFIFSNGYVIRYCWSLISSLPLVIALRHPFYFYRFLPSIPPPSLPSSISLSVSVTGSLSSDRPMGGHFPCTLFWLRR